MIEPFVESGFILPESLSRTIRRQAFGAACNCGSADRASLVKLVDGVWWTTKEVGVHTDNHPLNFITTGLILVNDRGTRLRVGADPFRLLDIPVGTVYRLESRLVPHGTVQNSEGLFAFLAWDCPILDMKPIREWAMEACDELSRLFAPWREEGAIPNDARSGGGALRRAKVIG